ncbi:restriction endonuclease subunit M [Erythrobacter sp. SAORIC-644]|uniref:Eco57I restriction-modification methylase domain-containing protein n=1 Tax=Erythrobacter sp. SAORIC-644 TaxID=1869314 RepID=UPI000C9F326D|nr:DNA methyltransferase [Erythrobacter sp. SAORIC-644]PNQ76984.1 restriction endonuclease subunit M [Erythrobacter sp. SAORIC-644]
MTKTFQPLFTNTYLRATLADEYSQFKGSDREKEIIEILGHWAARSPTMTETQEEGAFLDRFFGKIWGYHANGEASADQGFTRFPKYKVAGAGQTGGTGEADLALGWFERDDVPDTPQVLCEFKDIRSNLDAPQKRKGNTRSPVKQCADYLREAGKELYGNEVIQPTWGVVTDMNEFRLYWRNRMPAQYQRFTISPATTDDTVSLLADSEEASFQRFLFGKLFHADVMLSTDGDSPLLGILRQQWILEKEIENDFYKEYRAYRERLYNTLVAANPDFPGTRGKLVRLAQKVIDRCIFVLFCEDMGEALAFPPNALRDYLNDLSKMSSFDANAQDAWNKLKELFHAMDKGDQFLGKRINRFNGGLFEADPELDGLKIPNCVFCERMQGESEEAIKQHRQTLLYMSAIYNFGTSGSGEHAITLYTLGRIFEQSITELEVLEAEADDKVSLTKETKRKRDGVYYTPEWVVQIVVEETIGARLREIQGELGWSSELEGDDEYVRKQRDLAPSAQSQRFKAHVEAVQTYKERLNTFTVCDPACGSGAFLIHVLEYLLKERLRVSAEIARVTRQGETLFEVNSEQEIREILSRNIYGVDINPSSVEITKLALWLHTAKPDQALCDLDENIRDGNSLIGPEFSNFKQLSLLSEDKQEEINVFDWKAAFPKIFDSERVGGAGFDCIVGNPPYVKIQNFRKKYAEMADFLREGKNANATPVYQSTQKGNFDLFLPFIEKGIGLLNDKGRLGYIAPSLWRYNEYGEGLRTFLHDGRYLDRWVDFGSFQVFDEAITYTALQFYSKVPSKHVRFVLAHDGSLADAPDWDDPNWAISYSELPQSDTWIFVPLEERKILKRLDTSCKRLDDPAVTQAIFQGLKTSADWAYNVYRIGNNKYACFDSDKNRREVEIEDSLVKPLVSGESAARYCRPKPEKSIVFPYKLDGDTFKLYSAIEMQTKFPKGWRYLKSIEQQLRDREDSGFDDDQWYRFGRNQNILKQDKAKLGAATTIREMEVFSDPDGEFCFSGARVEGILPANPDDAAYLLGVLNSPIATFVIQRIGRPKSGGFVEANKQFIAPLPIPDAKEPDRKSIGKNALALQELHSNRRDMIEGLEARYSSFPHTNHAAEWLFPDIGSIAHLKQAAPVELTARQKTKWAKDRQAEKLKEKLTAIDVKLQSGAAMEATFQNGELRFLIDGAPIIGSVYVNDDTGDQVLLYWQHVVRSISATEKLTGKALIERVRNVPLTNNVDLRKQISNLFAKIVDLEQKISDGETELNEIIIGLYNLTAAEKKAMSL